MNITNKLESGLIVNLKGSNIYAIEAFIETSEFYGYEIEDQVYLFPSPVSEYDILERALTAEFNSWNIKHYSFEGV
jgi:hypothetical protein